MVLCIGSLTTAPLIMFNLSGVKCLSWMFWCSSIGIFSFCEGNLMGWSAKTISFLVYIELYNFTSVVIKAFIADEGCCMDWFLLHHFKWFVVNVYCSVSATYLCVKFF